MLGWDTESKLSEERNKDCKCQRLFKRKRGCTREQDKEKWEELI